MGRPNTRLPVKAAENTKSMRIAIGFKIVVVSGFELFPRMYINDAMSAT